MPKFTSWQLFILMVLALAALVALNILGKVDTSIVVGVLLSALGIGAHVSGVNTAVPLVSADAASVTPLAPLLSVPAAQPAAPTGMESAG